MLCAPTHLKNEFLNIPEGTGVCSLFLGANFVYQLTFFFFLLQVTGNNYDKCKQKRDWKESDIALLNVESSFGQALVRVRNQYVSREFVDL